MILSRLVFGDSIAQDGPADHPQDCQEDLRLTASDPTVKNSDDAFLPAAPVRRFVQPHLGDYSKDKMNSNIKASRSGLYKVARIQSPLDIILQPAVFWAPKGWYNELQRFYSDGEINAAAIIKTSRVYKNHLYAWNSFNFGWSRVLVESVDLINQTALVRVIDEGVTASVHLNELRELSVQFWSFPWMGWKFSLHNLKPMRKNVEWSENCLRRLRDVCRRGDDVMGYLPQTVQETPAPIDNPLSLIMIKTDAEESIQHFLVSNKLAEIRRPYYWMKDFEELS